MISFTYRPHQTKAVQAINAAFRAGIRRPLVNMCVGSGKSLAMASTALENWQRGERSLILVHRPELVKQDQAACERIGLRCGINAAKLDRRDWRGPTVVAMINSVFQNPGAFGQVDNILIDECHTIPFGDTGMYRSFLRAFPHARIAGFTGTPFRMHGGSLIDGEGALFERIVYNYEILDGIRDGYLVPAFSAESVDNIDVSKLKKNGGEYTASSQDAQTMALMDSHIMQMMAGGADRRAWLIFEASQKAALAMADRLNAWGVPAAAIIDKTKNRGAILDAFDHGQLRALVNVETLTTGYDSPRIDLICFRRRTKSLGLFVQMCGRGLRTIGGNINASIAAGKADCLYYDFAGLIAEHGALDFLRPKSSRVRFVSCEECGTRNAAASAKCWQCGATMMKNCPACLEPVAKFVLDCPHCAYDMRREEAERKAPRLLETPSGAALIASWKSGAALEAGWQPIRQVWVDADTQQTIAATADGARWVVPLGLAAVAPQARWLRGSGASVEAFLCPNGGSRKHAWQVTADGTRIVVPLPSAVTV